MDTQKQEITVSIDARNLLCPLPLLRLRKALEKISKGKIVEIITTDPVATIDIPHFCKEEDHDLLETTDNGSSLRFLIRRGP